MTAPAPTFAGWYPDPDTGGTKFSDGLRWTGDTRPRRKPFAAASAHRGWGIALAVFGILSVVTSPSQFSQPQVEATSTTSPIGSFFFAIVFGLALAAFGVYLFRGQGPATKAVEARVAAGREARAAAEREAAQMRSRRPAAPYSAGPGAAPVSHDAAAAAQINALANPDTAVALQNLQKLLYTQAISEGEYQAAKDKLLGTHAAPDSSAQIVKLAELHRAGILSDMEFAAAKAQALGL